MSTKKSLAAGSISCPLPISLSDDDGPEYWQSHIDNWQRSGLSQASYCRSHGLDYGRFRKCKERLSSYPTARSPIKLVEVKRDFTVDSTTGSHSQSFGSSCPEINIGSGGHGGVGVTGGFSGIRFWCAGFCIEVDVKFSSAGLSQLVRTLQRLNVKNMAGES